MHTAIPVIVFASAIFVFGRLGVAVVRALGVEGVAIILCLAVAYALIAGADRGNPEPAVGAAPGSSVGETLSSGPRADLRLGGRQACDYACKVARADASRLDKSDP